MKTEHHVRDYLPPTTLDEAKERKACLEIEVVDITEALDAESRDAMDEDWRRRAKFARKMRRKEIALLQVWISSNTPVVVQGNRRDQSDILASKDDDLRHQTGLLQRAHDLLVMLREDEVDLDPEEIRLIDEIGTHLTRRRFEVLATTRLLAQKAKSPEETLAIWTVVTRHSRESGDLKRLADALYAFQAAGKNGSRELLSAAEAFIACEQSERLAQLLFFFTLTLDFVPALCRLHVAGVPECLDRARHLVETIATEPGESAIAWSAIYAASKSQEDLDRMRGAIAKLPAESHRVLCRIVPQLCDRDEIEEAMRIVDLLIDPSDKLQAFAIIGMSGARAECLDAVRDIFSRVDLERISFPSFRSLINLCATFEVIEPIVHFAEGIGPGSFRAYASAVAAPLTSGKQRQTLLAMAHNVVMQTNEPRKERLEHVLKALAWAQATCGDPTAAMHTAARIFSLQNKIEAMLMIDAVIRGDGSVEQLEQ